MDIDIGSLAIARDNNDVSKSEAREAVSKTATKTYAQVATTSTQSQGTQTLLSLPL